MAIALSLTALGLLALIIYLLHSHQQQQKIDAVDRTVPLPPLEGDIHLPDADAPAAEPKVRAEPAPGAELKPESPAQSQPQAQPQPQPKAQPKALPEPQPESTAAPEPAPVPEAESAPIPAEPAQPPADWLARSRALKEQGHLEQALELVRSAYPQIGAFRHACVILRAQLRELRKAGADQAQQEAVLGALYHTCALAAFFHASDDTAPPLSLAAQRRLRERSWLSLPMPYDQLGTLHLDLLTTTDIRWLTAAWGKPTRHQQVRDYHADAWKDLQKFL